MYRVWEGIVCVDGWIDGHMSTSIIYIHVNSYYW